jgi:serine/threonine-protein kinase
LFGEDDVEGTPFGRYRLVELLGRGGMGEVWRAFDTVTNRIVALKVLPAHLVDDQTYQERFRREAQAAAGLNNPHVIPIHDFGEVDGRLFVDMRLIEGRDLHVVLADGPLEPNRAVHIVTQVAKALHAAHKVGLVHRDIKPSNILLADDDFAYLIDFGIARVAGEAGLTTTGGLIGTLHYMAPERFSTGQADARSDIYSLACVLYESLTGHCPYPGDSLEQQLAGHLATPPPRPSMANPQVPQGFDGVVAKGMAKDPDERYRTTVELAHATENASTAPNSRPESTSSEQQPTESASVRNNSPTVADPNFTVRAESKSDLAATQRRPLMEIPAQGQRPLSESSASTLRPPRWWRRKVVAVPAIVAVTIGIVIAAVILASTQKSGAKDSLLTAYGSQITLPFGGTSFPAAVAVDGADNLYVTDLDTGRVVKLASGSSTQTNLPFTGLKFPSGVATDSAGSVYVTDAGNNRVVKVTGDVSPDTVLPFGGLNNPDGVAVDGNGSVYVADTGNDRVLMLTGGGSQAVLPFVGLKAPAGVAVDTAGSVYVTDEGNNRVLKLTGAGPQTVLPFGGLKNPEGLTVDAQRNVYVTETVGLRVVKLAAESDTLSVLPFRDLVNPLGVAVDTAGDVYVADSSDDVRIRRVLKLPVSRPR